MFNGRQRHFLSASLANQAKNLALQGNFSEMKNFLKKIGSLPFRAIRISFVNRRFAVGRLEIDFKKPWQFLAKLPAEARAAGEGEAEQSSNSIW